MKQLDQDLKDQIKMLREKLESSIAMENSDKSAVLELSTALDMLINEFNSFDKHNTNS